MTEPIDATQRGAILRYFASQPLRKSISVLEAREVLSIMHPASVIHRLRKQGHMIDVEYVDEYDANGTYHRTRLYVYKGISQNDA